MKIVYIASSPHSGSTLLDLMLNGHSRGFTVGEIRQLPRFVGPEQLMKRCTCGAPSILECPFWDKVNTLVRERTGRTLSDLNIDTYRDLDACRRDNRILFEAVGAISGAAFVVDSSKDVQRLELLLSMPELDVLPIFLARNPKGQILSMTRSGERKQRQFAGLSGLIGFYSYQNSKIDRLVRNRPHFRVRYENLVRNPVAVLSPLMQSIGLEYEPQQQNFAVHERHNVGGNRMRRKTSNELRLDESWRRDLSFFQKVAIDIGTLPGRYAFRKQRPRIGAGR
ncbi:MAG: sulfotransferase [Bauldia sp.]|nr:sulfotransferase [Bauldia sp.]